jgi:hypothetical protein
MIANSAINFAQSAGCTCKSATELGPSEPAVIHGKQTAMSFDATEHPRGHFGRFSTKGQSAPEVGFSAWGSNDVTDFTDVIELVTLQPRTQDELFDAADGSRGEAGGTLRRVRIGKGFMYLDGIEVRGPSDGRPLLIDIEPDAGAGSIDVVSGAVIIRVDSNHPFDIRATGSAEALVIVAAGRSSMVEAGDSSQVTVISEDGARGYLSVTSALATGELQGDNPRFRRRGFGSF